MRLLSWLIMVPVAVLVIVFSVYNRAATTVDLTSFWNDWVLHARVPSHANLYPGNL